MENKNTLQDKLNRVSDEPGVYLMKDVDGDVIYIGKARNLRRRLTSYFKNSGQPDIKNPGRESAEFR